MADGRVEGGGELCEGLLGAVGDRTFLDGTVREAQARALAGAEGVVGPRDAVYSALAVRETLALGRARGAVRVVPTLTAGAAVVAFAGPPPALLHGGGDPAEVALDAREHEVPGVLLPGGGALRVPDAYVLPVRHWVELLWANLLALGPFLWASLVGTGPTAVARLGWAALRAGSTRPDDLAARLNVLGQGATIHRDATVEGCVLGPGARVGAGSVVRGSVLGAGAVVEELAIVEGCVLGRGARVQRMAIAKYSLIEAEAAHAGGVQLGVVGRGASVKHGATLLDMAIGQGVRVRVGGRLVDAPFGMCGGCVGDRAVLGAGVLVAPGRAVPPGVEIVADPSSMLRVLDLPAGCTRARAVGGRLEPL